MPLDLLSIADLSAKDLRQVLTLAVAFKQGKNSTALAGKNVALLFDKPSLRTKVSFDVAIQQLEGHSIYLGQNEIGLGQREPVKDVAKALERYVECIVARVSSHEILKELAHHVSIPVINALSNKEHPCQAVGDLLTILEKRGELDGVSLAFVGDGNNVARSLAMGFAMTGVNFTIATPAGYELDQSTIKTARTLSAVSGSKIWETSDPQEAVHQADVVYTDVWASMGQENEAKRRLEDFHGFQVDDALLAHASPKVLFMHCMPAHYGSEVAPGMLEHPRSVVFQQAENRLHAQKGILELVFQPI